MAIIASTLARIKSDPLSLLGGAQRVNDVFARAGHVWRDRMLDPANTIALFILQILHRNTAIRHLRHLWKIDVYDSSYCDARKRLPLKAVASMVEELSCDGGTHNDNAGCWLGRRVLLADGTGIITPDTPLLQEQWPQPSAQKSGCGFPAIKLLALLNLATGMIRHLTIMSLREHEASQLAGMHQAMRSGDLLLADRAFCSFAHLAMLVAGAMDAVFRMHQRQVVDFTPGRPERCKRSKRNRKGVPTSRFVRKLGSEDQIVQWVRPVDKPAWMSDEQFAALPPTLQVRELRYHIVVKGQRTRIVTIATTLLDAMRYPKREIARLYGLRWEIETNFRHLKTTMGMEHLKCRSVDGVMKELMMYVLVYNLVRAAMTLAARRQNLADANRVSFVDALRRLQSMLTVNKSEVEVELIVNRPRPGRHCPRVKKKRMKAYDLMNKPRADYAQAREEVEVVS